MEYAYSRFFFELPVDCFENTVVIIDERRDAMFMNGTDRVPAVVPEVVDHHVEIVRQQRPERIIEIDRETVAMTQYETWTLRVSMTPQRDAGVVVHEDVNRGMRLGDFPYRFRARGQMADLSRKSFQRCGGRGI